MEKFYIFQSQVATMVMELLTQQVAKFNQASNGAIVLATGEHIGDFIEKTSWAVMSGLAQRRNAYSDKPVDSMELKQILDRAIKVDGRIGPVDVTGTQIKRLGKDMAEAVSVVSESATNQIMADQLNTSLLATKSAISTESKLISVDSGSISLRKLHRGTRVFGDNSSKLIAWAMSGFAYNDLIDSNLKNENRLFEYGSVSVAKDVSGRIIVITDAPCLSDTSNVDSVLGLVSGACVAMASPLSMAGNTVTGKENIVHQYQGEYDFTIGVKGFAWESKEKSPTDAMIGAKASWKKIASDVKDCAGVLLQFENKPEVPPVGE